MLHRSKEARVKGDRVEVLVDTGAGGVQAFEIVARRAGRRVEVSTSRGVVEVTEVTRNGTPVRAGRFMAARVIAVVEHPSADVMQDTSVPRLRSVGRESPGEGPSDRG
jgi:predicted aspartyl protease